VNEEKMSSYNK